MDSSEKITRQRKIVIVSISLAMYLFSRNCLTECLMNWNRDSSAPPARITSSSQCSKLSCSNFPNLLITTHQIINWHGIYLMQSIKTAIPNSKKHVIGFPSFICEINPVMRMHTMIKYKNIPINSPQHLDITIPQFSSVF